MKKELIKQYLKLLEELKSNFYKHLAQIETREKVSGFDTDKVEQEYEIMENSLKNEAYKRGIKL